MKSFLIRFFTVLCALALCFLAEAEEHEVLTWTGEGGTTWNDMDWTDSKGNAVKWTDGCIARHGGKNMGGGACEATAYAFYWDSGARVFNPMGTSAVKINLDAGGFVYGDTSGSATLMSRGMNLTFNLIADQTWTTVLAANKGSTIVQNAILTTSNGSTLTLANYFDLEIDSACDYPGAVVLQDHALLWVYEGKTLSADKLTVKGPNAVLKSTGAVSAVAGEIELTDGGTLTLDGMVWDLGALKVTGSQTCRVTGVVRIPHGSGFTVDVAEGSTLEFHAVALDAETGEVVVPVNSGAGTLTMSHVVTDVPETVTPLVIGSGETVFVAGDGLGDDVTVQLNGGQLRFVADATVAAKVEVHAASSITVDGGVEGTVSGALDSTFNNDMDANLLTFDGAGLKVFAGDATFATKAQFALVEGSVLVRDCTWTFVGAGTYSLNAAADTLAVSNATFDAWNGGAVFNVGVTGETGGVIELREGGVLKVGAGSCVQLGFANLSHGTLRINGGHYYDKYANSQMVVGLNGKGLVEILSGTFAPASVLRTSTGTGTVLWKGGRWLFDNSNCASIIGTKKTAGTYFAPITVIIDGDCTMQFNNTVPAGTINTVAPDITDLSATSDYPWYCTENGCLTLTNSASSATKVFTLNVRAPFTNMNLRVGSRIKVAVESGCPAANLNDWVIGPDSVPYADIWADGTDPLAMNGVAVVAGGTFDLADADGLEFANLRFAADATLASSVAGTTLPLTGTLTLPGEGETLNYQLARGYAPCDLITAEGGVSGNPVFVKGAGSKKAQFTVGTTALSFDCPGLLLLFR